MLNDLELYFHLKFQVSLPEGQLSGSAVEPVSCDPGQLLVVPTNEMFAPFGQNLPQAVVTTAAFASPASGPVELGAEVVCCQIGRPNISFQDPEVSFPVVDSVSGRCSYEEVVYSEMEHDQSLYASPKSLSHDEVKLEDCLRKVTSWAVILRYVKEDRDRVGLLGLTLNDAGSTNCVCKKAQNIMDQLEALNNTFIEAIDSSGGFNVDDLLTATVQVEATLRTNVSIQVKFCQIE